MLTSDAFSFPVRSTATRVSAARVGVIPMLSSEVVFGGYCGMELIVLPSNDPSE
jgi:hypothetical protein